MRLGDVYPVMAQLANGNWVVVLGALDAEGGDGTGEPQGPAVNILDPLADHPEPFTVTKEAFCTKWQGDAVVLKRSRQLGENQPAFGLRWFLPELFRERRLFMDVGIAAIFLYALGLVTPIFFQLIIDKVLVHESYMTLYVLAAGAALGLAFDALFTFLRRYYCSTRPTRSTSGSPPKRSAIC